MCLTNWVRQALCKEICKHANLHKKPLLYMYFKFAPKHTKLPELFGKEFRLFDFFRPAEETKCPFIFLSLLGRLAFSQLNGATLVIYRVRKFDHALLDGTKQNCYKALNLISIAIVCKLIFRSLRVNLSMQVFYVSYGYFQRVRSIEKENSSEKKGDEERQTPPDPPTDR